MIESPQQIDTAIGPKMHGWASVLFPIARSITGPGIRETLEYLKDLLPALEIQSIASGSSVFDWTVPDEWTILSGYIEDEVGQKIIDFANNNLHVVGYSEPVDQWLDLEVLDEHLYSLPDQPNAMPYVTSYYQRRWGFCLSHNMRERLKPGRYRAVIDSELKPGVLNYGELLIPGKSDEEVFISTYVCHPSMANNELSGPVVTTAIAQWIQALPERRYTYRIVFIPETIGSLVYLSRHLDHLKQHVIAGFNVTCIGDDRAYSYLPSKAGDTLSDQAAKHVLRHIDPQFVSYSWLDRGSDERQYCAPGVDLPIATIMRSKYGEYPEYHTSLDDLNLVTPAGLKGGYLALKLALEVIEQNIFPKITVLGEPQLGKRGLYPNISKKRLSGETQTLMNLLTYCDGKRTLLEIADLIGQPMWDLVPFVEQLKEYGLLNS